MQYEYDPTGRLTPEELNKLRKIKEERRTEDILPRDLFSNLAIKVRVVGINICKDLGILNEGPLKLFNNYFQDEYRDLAATIKTGITSEEFWIKYWHDGNIAERDRNVPVLRPEFSWVNLDLPDLIISIPLLQHIDLQEELKPECWETAYKATMEFARRLEFLGKNEVIDRSNPQAKFIESEVQGFSGAIEIPHPHQPFTLNLGLTDKAAKDGFPGIPQYQGKGIGIDHITITYRPKN